MNTHKALSLFAALALVPALSCAAPAAVAEKAPAKKPAVAAAKPAAKAPAKAAKPAAQAATAPVALKASEASVVKVLGDSTLHKWDAKASVLSITGELAPKAGSLLEQVKAGALSKLALVIAVEGLKSNEGKSMDKNMHKALESDKFKEISFNMTGYSVAGDVVTAKGSLSIHGVAKDVELKGTLSAKGDAINVKGSFDSMMNDWGVKPPVMMMGTVRVADKISIEYDFDLAP